VRTGVGLRGMAKQSDGLTVELKGQALGGEFDFG
jgi:hypothetical protein